MTVSDSSKNSTAKESGVNCARPCHQETAIMTATQTPPKTAAGRKDFCAIICIYSNQAANAKNNIPAANTGPPCQNTYSAIGVATSAVNIRVPSTFLLLLLGLYAAKTTIPVLIVPNGPTKLRRGKIRPKHIGNPQFGICQLPKQKIADPQIAAGTD